MLIPTYQSTLKEDLVTFQDAMEEIMTPLDYSKNLDKFKFCLSSSSLSLLKLYSNMHGNVVLYGIVPCILIWQVHDVQLYTLFHCAVSILRDIHFFQYCFSSVIILDRKQ